MSGLILPPGSHGPGASASLEDDSDISIECDCTEEEKDRIAKVLVLMGNRAGHDGGRGATSMTIGAWDDEVKDRMAEIGFIADVVWWHTNVEGVKIPQVIVKERRPGMEIDLDKEVYDITHDTYGFGGGEGVIKTGYSKKDL